MQCDAPTQRQLAAICWERLRARRFPIYGKAHWGWWMMVATDRQVRRLAKVLEARRCLVK